MAVGLGARNCRTPHPPLPEAFVPYHKIPKTHIHEDLIAIEREGETVVSVTADGTWFHVFTSYPVVPVVETRDPLYSNAFGGGSR